MSGLRLLAALGAVGLLAACPNCPPAIQQPAAALVGVEGSARVVGLGDAAYEINGMAWLDEARLLVLPGPGDADVIAPAALMDPATGARSPYQPSDDAGGTWHAVAPAAGGGAWVSLGDRIARLQRDDRLVAFAHAALGPAAPPSVDPNLELPASDDPGLGRDPRPQWDAGALADDGLGGAFFASNAEVWLAAKDAPPRRLVTLLAPVVALVPWGGGALALCQGEPVNGEDEAKTPNTLWEIERGGKARLWKQAAQVTRPQAIAGGPEGEVVVAEAGRGESQYPDTESPYSMAVRRITADGRGRVLLRSQDATAALGGYKIMMSCASAIWPADFTPAHLAMSPARRVAVVMPTRGKLLLWSP